MKPKIQRIKEVIVVEGRSDTRAVTRAVEAMTIETSGYGINEEVWRRLHWAEEHQGLIIFTDPDYMGEKIRQRLKEAFPRAKHAYIDREQGNKSGNIGVENASEQAILMALKKARPQIEDVHKIFSAEDLQQAGMLGDPRAAQRRRAVGTLLGIGYSNGKGLLKKLNGYGITRKEWDEALQQIDCQSTEGGI